MVASAEIFHLKASLAIRGQCSSITACWSSKLLCACIPHPYTVVSVVQDTSKGTGAQQPHSQFFA